MVRATDDAEWVVNPNTSDYSRWYQRYVHLLNTNSADNTLKQLRASRCRTNMDSRRAKNTCAAD